MTRILLIFFILLLAGQMDAQRRERNPMSELSFGERLWYGGSFVLGYNSGPDYSTFQIGIAPMVGYKFTPSWSAGPRAELVYTYYKVRLIGGNETVHPITYKGSAFTRLRFAEQFFGHAEFGFSRYRFPLRDAFGFYLDENGDVATETETYADLFLGGGYTSGGRVSGEISVLYNVLEESSSFNTPFYIRAGFNVNF